MGSIQIFGKYILPLGRKRNLSSCQKYKLKIKLYIPWALYFNGLSLHAFSLYLFFRVLFKVLLHVRYNFVLNVFDVFVHTHV